MRFCDPVDPTLKGYFRILDAKFKKKACVFTECKGWRKFNYSLEYSNS